MSELICLAIDAGTYWDQNENSDSASAVSNGTQEVKGKNEQEVKQPKGHHEHKVTKTQGNSHQPDLFDELLGKIESQGSKIKILEKHSKEKNEGMAKVTKLKGTFENVNDSHANTNIAETFNKLYDIDWVKLLKWLGRTFSKIPEIELIHKITDLLKNGYKECLLLADVQLREFLMLDEDQCIPDYKNHLEFYAVRKQHLQSDIAREKVKKKVTEKLLHDEIVCFCTDENMKETKQNLKTFLLKCVDCCWLMVVSTPPISLNFGVVGKPFCSEHFSMYSTKKPVDDETKVEGTVYEVVWPSVSLKDGSVFYKKGNVIVVSKGVEKAKRNENSECNCLKLECNDYLEKSFGRRNKETIEGFEKKPSGKRMVKNTGRDKPSKQSYV